MKKLVSLLLLVAVSVMLLNGITMAESKKPELEVWFFKTYTPSADEHLEQLVKEFAEKHDAIIHVSFFGWNDMDPKTITAIEGNDPPDVAEMRIDRPYLYYDMGELLDVSDIFTKVGKAGQGFLPAAKSAVTFKGRQYAMPYYLAPEVVYLRKDRLDAAGVKIPEKWTWEALRQVAIKTNQPSKGVWGFGLAYGATSDIKQTFRSIWWSYGGKLVEEDGKTIALKSPETLAALKFVTDLYTKDKVVPPGALNWDSGGNNRAWDSGQANIVINMGSLGWGMKNSKSEMVNKTLVLPTPAGPKGDYGFTNVFSLGIFKKSKYPELAKELVEYLFEEKNYSTNMELAGSAKVPSLRKFLNDPIWKDPLNKALVEEAEKGQIMGYAGPPNRAAVEVWSLNIIENMIGRVLADKWTPEKALDEAYNKVREIYAKYDK